MPSDPSESDDSSETADESEYERSFQSNNHDYEQDLENGLEIDEHEPPRQNSKMNKLSNLNSSMTTLKIEKYRG